MNALPVTAEPDPVTEHAGAATDGVVYWDPGVLRWLPLPGRSVPAKPDPADLVAVTFTRTQVLALFGLLRQATRRSYGLLITDEVRDAWYALSSAWNRANPGGTGRDDVTAKEASGPSPGRAG